MEWKDVFYNEKETNLQVTKCGKVRRVLVNWCYHKNGQWERKLGEIDLSVLKCRKGYSSISFMVKGEQRKHAGIHQLIASAFLGYRFDRMITVIHHKDFNKSNNDVNNLIIMSNRENCSIEKTLISGLPVGVWYDKHRDKYESYIKMNGKKKHLGRFDTAEEASITHNRFLVQTL